MFKGKTRVFYADPPPDTGQRESPDYQFKFLLIGDKHVGKSALVGRFTGDYFSESYIDISSTPITVSKQIKVDDKTVSIRIAEYPESLESLKRSWNDEHYAYKNAIIVMFDVTNLKSFENVKALFNDPGNAKLLQKRPIILVGSKVDEKSKRVVDQRNIEVFLDDINNKGNGLVIDAYIETSAKRSVNVDRVFSEAAKAVIRRQVTLQASSRDKATASDPKLNIIAELDKYIQRIESYKSRSGTQPNFSYGFWIASTSRALNREANYHLAKYLREELKKPDSTIAEVFSDISEKRNHIIEVHSLSKRDGFVKRNINSDELNAIINAARLAMDSETSETRPLLTKS